MKAIETQYKGYRFRSRLEARWAVFFDVLGLQWDYEPEGFEFEGGVRYLPDFELQQTGDQRLFVEVKAEKPTKEEINKAKLLAAQGNCLVLFAIGVPDIDKIYELDGYCGRVDDGCYWADDIKAGITAYCFRKWGYAGVCMYEDCIEPLDHVAVQAARSARFEFGERGAKW